MLHYFKINNLNEYWKFMKFQKKWLVFVNPFSGHKQAVGVWKKAKPYFEIAGY